MTSFRIDTKKLTDNFSYEQSCRHIHDIHVHKVRINNISGVVDHSFIVSYCVENKIPVPRHFECNYGRIASNGDVMNEYGDVYGDRLDILVRNYSDQLATNQFTCVLNEKMTVLRQDVVAKWFVEHDIKLPTELISVEMAPIPQYFRARKRTNGYLTVYKGEKDTLYIVNLCELPSKKDVWCAVNEEKWVERRNPWLCQWFTENKLEFPSELDKTELPDVEYSGNVFVGKSGDSIGIAGWCLESYPCQHDCVLNGKNVRMDGVKIAKWFVSENLMVPNHFRCYL